MVWILLIDTVVSYMTRREIMSDEDAVRVNIVPDGDDSSWTDGESLHSNPRASNLRELRTIAHELETIRANVQIMLDRVLKALHSQTTE